MRALRLGCDPSGSGSSFLQSVRLELFIGLGCLCCLSTLKSTWTPSKSSKTKAPTHLSLAAALHKPAPGPCRDCQAQRDSEKDSASGAQPVVVSPRGPVPWELLVTCKRSNSPTPFLGSKGSSKARSHRSIPGKSARTSMACTL